MPPKKRKNGEKQAVVAKKRIKRSSSKETENQKLIRCGNENIEKPSTSKVADFGKNDSCSTSLKINGEKTTNNENELIKISEINPFKSKWVIKARVVSKKPIHLWNNDKSSGKLFNFNLIDGSGEIRVTAFNEMVDKFFDKIENECVFLFSNADIKKANTKYMNVKNNFELILTNDTEIEKCTQNSDDVPNVEYKFESIGKIKKLSKNAIVNVMGVCYDIKSIYEFTSKNTGKLFKKREIELIDESRAKITVNLWNDDAEKVGVEKLRCIMTIINGQRNEYMGKTTININRETTIEFDQKSGAALLLKEWFENQNNIISAEEVTDSGYIPIADVFNINLQSKVNVLGVCFDVGVLKSFTSKADKELKKRNVTIVDETLQPIVLTIWNSEAESFSSEHTNSIVYIQTGQLKELNESRIITHTPETVITLNPKMIEAEKLKTWFINVGKDLTQKQISNMAFAGFDN